MAETRAAEHAPEQQSSATTLAAHADEGSIRSRASSVVSTGTKFSILTLPPDSASHPNIDGVLHNVADGPSAPLPRLVPRPMSMYSFRSTGEALPPYSEQLAGQGEGEADGDRPATARPLPSHGGQRDRRRRSHELSAPADEDEANDDDDDDNGLPLPPATPTSIHDPENALARHYGSVVRTIDENNARAIARMKGDHAQELATMRNAIDGEYRKVLKERNREIERVREVAATRENELEGEVARLQKELDGRGVAEEVVARAVEETEERMEALVEGRCAKARHLVEDLWEERWQRRNELAAEESKRSEREWRETMRVVSEEREERWREAVELLWGPEGLARAKREVEKMDVG